MTDNGASALASILHDTYGCRITCRGGRLADDRHPSHAEAYLDTATRVLASLDAEGWTLVTVPGPGESAGYDREQALRAAIRDANALYEEMAAERAHLNDGMKMLALDIEAKTEEIATLRAALDGLVAALKEAANVHHVTTHSSIAAFADCDLPFCQRVRAALATAKETGG